MFSVRLEGSFDALRRFTADASHELRTPLTALRSVGEIAVRETGEVETLRETIGSMLEEGQRLHNLADTLLMVALAVAVPVDLEETRSVHLGGEDRPPSIPGPPVGRLRKG